MLQVRNAAASSGRRSGRGRLADRRAVVLALLLASCATPLPPTGGPPDRTPPALTDSEPAAGAVNVTAHTVRLTFSEHVDQASLARALSVTPEFDRPPVFKWKGRRVEITFPDTLRANTTYILTMDNTLRDLHSVALKQPITLAFSTGPEINRGRLAGQVVEALRGEGVAGFDVYAYAAPDSTAPSVLPERPAYRTQTDERGRFQFEYMSREPFFVIALRDRNRNRQPDPPEPFAVPPRPVLRADSTAPDDGLRWLVTVRDTLPPELRRIRTLSSRRVVLRFADPVRLARADTAGWVLRDSLTSRPVALHGVYMLPDDPRQVFLLTDSLAVAPHLLRPGAVTDSSGNPVPPGPYAFTPAAAADVALRFLGFLPDGDPTPLPPTAWPGIRFNQSLATPRLQALVAVHDSTDTPPAVTFTTDDGTAYRLHLTPRPDRPFSVSVDGRPLDDTLYTRTYTPLTAEDLGELSGHALADDTTGTLIVELFPAEARTGEAVQTTRTDTTGYFIFRNLPRDARYRFRAFLDRNGNGRWDGGLIRPYTPAEPLTWHADLPAIRARWEQEAPDTLRVR